ncbi:MAG: gliding motility protein GldN [Paramuribaculum sp.]|nr:gliding motility protein GldN [Paramuribaculum sp.]
MHRYIFLLTAIVISFHSLAQQSVSSGVSKGTTRAPRTSRQQNAGVTDRQISQLSAGEAEESDLAWMKVVYRSLDLDNAVNAALYYPETPVEGEENLFRMMMRLLASGTIPAYEYLDGREVFSQANQLNVGEMLERFNIIYSEAKGSTAKKPLYEIDDTDIPSSEVLTYYIIERWELDRRDSRMRTRVVALCPVLHRTEEFGQEAVRYPMFWVRYADIRPYLRQHTIFTDDDNNLATSTYDDFFTLGLYKGDIYKTRNLRNKSMMQLYPDPDDLARARDSIDRRLNSFESSMWVPTLEELEERSRIAAETADTTSVGDSRPVGRKSSPGRVSSGRKASKKAKEKSVSRRSTPAAARSVRNRKK